MTKLESLRSRFMRDPIPIRLGGLAANLARLGSFSKNEGHRDVVLSILFESKWFIEWTSADLNILESAELVELQIQLALWSLQSHNEWSNDNWRNKLANESNQWSQRILEMSGLIV